MTATTTTTRVTTPQPRLDMTTTPACNALVPPTPRPPPSSARFQPALRSVGFCSCYIYSPRGNSFGSAASRQLCARLKLGDATWLPHYAGVVRNLTTRHEALAELFGADAVLVPVPGSDPSATRTGRRTARRGIARCPTWKVRLARRAAPLPGAEVRHCPQRRSPNHTTALRVAFGGAPFPSTPTNCADRRRDHQGAHHPGSCRPAP